MVSAVKNTSCIEQAFHFRFLTQNLQPTRSLEIIKSHIIRGKWFVNLVGCPMWTLLYTVFDPLGFVHLLNAFRFWVINQFWSIRSNQPIRPPWLLCHGEKIFFLGNDKRENLHESFLYTRDSRFDTLNERFSLFLPKSHHKLSSPSTLVSHAHKPKGRSNIENLSHSKAD